MNIGSFKVLRSLWNFSFSYNTFKYNFECFRISTDLLSIVYWKYLETLPLSWNFNYSKSATYLNLLWAFQNEIFQSNSRRLDRVSLCDLLGSNMRKCFKRSIHISLFQQQRCKISISKKIISKKLMKFIYYMVINLC